jgi:integrase
MLKRTLRIAPSLSETAADSDGESAAKQAGGTWASLVNVAPNLYRHPRSGTYYGRCKITGRKQLHCLDTADRKTADRKLSEWLDSARRVRPEVSRSTLDELLTRFHATRVHCEDATKIAEQGFTTSFRAVFDCNRRLSSIRGSELKAFVNGLARERDYSANTYNRVCLFLRQLFELARVDGMTADNLYEVSGLRYQTVHRKTPSIPTAEQFQRILDEVRAEKKNRKGVASGDFLEFQGRAGLGQAEASELKWTDIDFEAGEMKIKRVKTGKYFTVPIYPKLRPLLVRMRSEAKARAQADDRELQSDERVFIIDNARKALTNACARLELPEFTQRNLRQMFIVEAYRAGVDVKTIAKWQGHQDGGKLILDTYTEVFGADQREFEKKQLMKLAL